jgi:hypothetical protein
VNRHLRTVNLTDRGMRLVDELRRAAPVELWPVDRPNLFGLVKPRCVRCSRPVGACPGHGKAVLP